MQRSIGIHHMGRYGLDVVDGTTLCPYEIAVAHQCDVLTFDADNAMDDVSTTFHPGQHHVANLWRQRLLQDDTLTPADDKRQHAPSVDG